MFVLHDLCVYKKKSTVCSLSLKKNVLYFFKNIAQYAYFLNSIFKGIHRSDIKRLVFNDRMLVRKRGRETGDTTGNISR